MSSGGASRYMLGLPCRRGSTHFAPPSTTWPQCQRPPSASRDSTDLECRQHRSPRTGPKAPCIYDTTPLKTTLEELVDFDLINRGHVRLSVGAANVCTGASHYFDTHNTQIHADHIRASGALPPGFPSVMIDGEHYWDGGVVTNTPITYVADEKPLTTARIIQVDTFNAQGGLPQNLGQVSERAKDIQYSSKSRSTSNEHRNLASSLR